MTSANPVFVEVTRGPAVESVHRGAAVVVDAATGRVVASWGDTERPAYPRSAIKPLQALPLLTSGAARAFEVSAAEIALACASHNGEPVHTEAVDKWLNRIGCDAGMLECGAHPPTDPVTRRALDREDGAISPLHNNCSGKHTGFLTTCRHLGFDPAGYVHVDHPVQRLVRDTVASLTGCDLTGAHHGVDGCGIPVYAIPLRGLAAAMAKYTAGAAGADPAGLDPASVDAVRSIRESMINHPYLVAGRDRFCTVVMETLAPNVLVKTGAEGVFCAALPERGLGIALKIDDGATRASEVALGGVLRWLGAINESQFRVLRSKLEPEIRNVAGAPVGVIRVSREIAVGS